MEPQLASLFDIAGQVAVVTGAGRGLGAALAAGLGAAGARVVAGDLDQASVRATAERLRQAGAQAIGVGCDIREPQSVRALCGAALEEFGAPQIWINNAGINIPKPAEELTLDEWSQIITTNLTGTFICCQQAGTTMLARGSGCIINICSIHGHVGSYVHKAAAYNASKAGIINLTRSLALEWGERGVRVNGISPGPLATELMATRLASPEYNRMLLERMAIKRVGAPEDVVGTALFLASPAAAWITGQILAVDGGWLAA
jgi:NAD(P)-dependent dehydrogenase (short-subunit alcohol dehydrogenase family)